MEEPLVTTAQGILRGKLKLNYLGYKYFSFQGVPYSKAPIGTLRFRPPQPPEPWSGIKDALVEKSDSLQIHFISQQVVGNEDCLFLNIYTPQLPVNSTAQLKPVMLYIHGGDFTHGSGRSNTLGPDFLITEDVVIVTVNYRLGLLGFMCLEDSALGVTGNAGFKDVVCALKWIQQNISQFLGDPNNVTIFGNSSGAIVVHLLVLSHATKGLFHRAICQSACALNSTAPGRSCSKDLFKLFNCSDEETLLKILQKLPAKEIIAIQQKIEYKVIANFIYACGFVIEKPAKDAFLIESPIKILRSGNFHKVPFMIGVVENEGVAIAMYRRTRNLNSLISNFEETIPNRFNAKIGSKLAIKLADYIKTFYFDGEDSTPENLDKCYSLLSDAWFTIELYRSARYQLNYSSTPIYVYKFTVDGNLNSMKIMSQIPANGSCHTDELGYLFKNKRAPIMSVNSIEDITVRRMVKLWATFARTGNPNPTTTNDLININWPAAEKGKMHFLNIGEDLTVGFNPDAHRIAFWDKLDIIAKL